MTYKSSKPVEAYLVKPKWRRRTNAVVWALRARLLFCFDWAVLLLARRRSQGNQGAIFCLHGLGDLLLAGHAIERLAEWMRSQEVEPVLFVRPTFVEFARRAFGVARVEGINRYQFSRQLRYRIGILKSVTGRFAVAVQPTFNRMFRVEDCLMRATGAAQRIGNAGHANFILPSERRLGDRFYTQLVELQPGPMHELLRYAEFMKGMGLEISQQPWQPGSNGEFQTCSAGLVPTTPYMVLAPSASHPRRSWPMESFLKVAQHIASRHQLAIVMIGHKPHDSSAVMDLGGKTAVEDLPGLLASARFILCNDSGIYHLGVSLSRPTLAVGGGGMPTRYFPYPDEAAGPSKAVYHSMPCADCNWKCSRIQSRRETAPCLQEVAWQEVAEAAEALLQRES